MFLYPEPCLFSPFSLTEYLPQTSPQAPFPIFTALEGGVCGIAWKSQMRVVCPSSPGKHSGLSGEQMEPPGAERSG